MGVGKVDGEWHATEDFRWHAEFADFLEAASAQGAGRVDLIFAGDTFDLWQSLDDKTCDYESLQNEIGKRALDLGCTQDEALARFARVEVQHKSFFKSVGRFVMQGENRVTLLPGNHDAALLFPEVSKAVLKAFPKTARPRIHIASESYWISADGMIYVEHGHQIGADPNCFQKWPKGSFLQNKGKLHLRKPLGEQFVQKLYNRYESEFPTIDNLSEEVLGAWYAIKARGLLGTLEELGRAIRFIFTQLSWDQVDQILGEDGVPIWKLDVELAKLDTSEKRWKFLVESRPRGDPFRTPFAGVDFAALPVQAPFSKEEVEAICDRRWLLRKQVPGSGIQECESTGELGAISEKVAEFRNPKTKNERFRRHLTNTQAAIPTGSRPNTWFAFFVYGHTHKEEADYAPFDVTANWKPVVYNSGAWQRTATPEAWCTIARSKGYSDAEALEKLKPEDLPPCYSFVTVARGSDGKLLLKQMYWVQASGNAPGSAQPSCSAIPQTLKECL
jgi:UDP-2,3-diacylglucosamine pyrophosphatase LpxH